MFLLKNSIKKVICLINNIFSNHSLHFLISFDQMVRPSKRKIQSKKARKCPPMKITNIVRFVLSVARCGMSHAQADEFCLSNDIIPPPNSTFYLVQRKLIPIIEALARETCSEARSHMKGPYSISYDGSWSSRQ